MLINIHFKKKKVPLGATAPPARLMGQTDQAGPGRIPFLQRSQKATRVTLHLVVPATAPQ